MPLNRTPPPAGSGASNMINETHTESTPFSTQQQEKRKRSNLSPENPVGDLMLAIQKMGEKFDNNLASMSSKIGEQMAKLASKEDIGELKDEIGSMSHSMGVLRAENQALKQELEQLRNDRERDRKELNRLIEQSNSRNIILKGLQKDKANKRDLEDLFRRKMEMSQAGIRNSKILFERNNKVGVLVEFETTDMAMEALKSGRKLTGSSIYIERDLSLEKQERKIVLLQLKKSLLGLIKKSG
ncbi:hypothetical protein ACLKA6_004302 [Drosophila palustris]